MFHPSSLFPSSHPPESRPDCKSLSREMEARTGMASVPMGLTQSKLKKSFKRAIHPVLSTCSMEVPLSLSELSHLIGSKLSTGQAFNCKMEAPFRRWIYRELIALFLLVASAVASFGRGILALNCSTQHR